MTAAGSRWGATLVMLLVATTALSCHNQETQPPSTTEESLNLLKPIPLKDVCERLVDDRTSSELEEGEVYARNIAALFSHVPRLLRQKKLTEPLSVCTFSLDPTEKERIDIGFAWSNDGFPLEGKRHSKDHSTRYRISSDVVAESKQKTQDMNIWVRCEAQDPSSGEEEKNFSVLKGLLTDRVGISDQARLRLLVESARRVTAHMGCENEPEFPDVSDVSESAPLPRR